MQLNKFTDYGLRILLYISPQRDEVYTIAELAENLKVSQNHLVKIVHFMAKQHWIITTRGKGGGIRLSPSTLNLPLGEMIRTLQNTPHIINCHNPACVLRPQCRLKGVLDFALEHFYHTLNQHKFAEFVLSHPHSIPIKFFNE
ncbi:transcriptional regulator [Rodentibacter caecimuris]|uniref:Transcriptional regulator n=1 Tax=Rodentibacter caecimuris TaxID=1796644 RepID=A0A1V3KJV0_9PAST|nr:Rrf2 family transcriptional regulator [Rodentibacter heylii]OOF77947.1 transcriptional regulator [Rodentibacter heylii]